MKHFTEEELLREIATGNRTLKGLGAKFGLSPSSIKSALTKLGISLIEKEPEPRPIKMDNLAASDDSEWDQLYNEYDLEGGIGTQAQLMIAQCRVIDGMTVAQARQYMKDNFNYEIIEIKFNKKRR